MLGFVQNMNDAPSTCPIRVTPWAPNAMSGRPWVSRRATHRLAMASGSRSSSQLAASTTRPVRSSVRSPSNCAASPGIPVLPPTPKSASSWAGRARAGTAPKARETRNPSATRERVRRRSGGPEECVIARHRVTFGAPARSSRGSGTGRAPRSRRGRPARSVMSAAVVRAVRRRCGCASSSREPKDRDSSARGGQCRWHSCQRSNTPHESACSSM